MAMHRTLFALVLLGCGGESPSPSEATGPRPSPASEPGETTPTPADPAPAVSPVTIRVINDTGAPVVLDRSFGPADPLGVERLDEALGAGVDLDQVDDEQTGGWIGTCQCACGGEPCPECEPPATVHVTLQPDEHYDLDWSGRLRRREDHPQGGACWTAFDPPAGRYALTACTTEERCARTEVRLPASDTIEIRLGQSARAAGRRNPAQ